MAAGFCAHGIAGAGGNGQVMAEWIVGGEPPCDLWKMDIRRFGDQYRSPRLLRWPAPTRCTAPTTTSCTPTTSARPDDRCASRRLYSRHEALGAVFGEKSGWERVNHYASNEDAAHEHLRPRGWAGQHWSTAIVTEHLATRRTAGLFDESSFAKIEVAGPGAVAFLQHLCVNDVDRAVGSVVYTSMLNSRGGIECDFTVTRLAAERFLIVTGTAFARHDLSWIEQHAPDDGTVSVRDVTSSMACFGLWGPSARDVLVDVCDDDLTFPLHAGPPHHRRRRAVLGAAGDLRRRARLGAVPADRVRAAVVGHARDRRCRRTGWCPAGYRAIDCLRLEKGYRVWGADITSETDPFAAGLGFAVRMDKEFLGRDRLSAWRHRTAASSASCWTTPGRSRSGTSR